MWIDWHRNISFFQNEKDLVAKHYPTLKYIKLDDNIKLTGELYVKEIDDSYTIEIIFLNDYPKSLPIVKEIGGDILQIEDRHINSDGSCCLCVPQLEKLYFPNNSNIKTFLDNLVVPFFANQAYFDLNGTWLNGEYSHGILGTYEFYNEILKVENINIILSLLKISIKTVPNLNKKCPCNSGKSIKRCHLTNINSLKEYTTYKQINKDIKVFKNIIIEIRKRDY